MAEIKWRRTAVQQLQRILEYGRIEFGETAANRLHQRLRDILRLLLSNPKMGRVEPLLAEEFGDRIRSLSFHKNYKLIYHPEISDENTLIYIEDIWDVRSNPSALANRGSVYDLDPVQIL